ncbi:pentapeptide repeat-containing protein [Crocosphaera sp.]|uniref:pentapeptide repeat-containing protein n=1 Tax=Crocosphaera sp. TaxID=2729996 RepID=UPI00262C2C2E|nr:pentapeptide repeat-containing protein [Crocosphaera sp.]MDJ0579247.1 pentapeptide repeat-containing protein [Crocosphaera sp.]
MKSTEIFKQYTEGIRDFKGQDLRGQNFRGKDLSGCDFSECDIRGTNFQEANLTETKFIKAKGGLTLKSKILLLLAAMILVALSGFLSGWSGYYISWIFDGSGIEYKISGGLTLASLFIFCVTSYRKGLAAGAFAIAFAFAVAGAVAFAVAGVVAVAFAVAFAGAIAFAFAFAGAVAVAGAVAGAVAVAFAVSVAFAFAGAVAFAFAGAVAGAVAFAVSVAVALTLLACVISYRTIKGDPRDAWLREFALAFASWGGTSFYSATVTDADFTGATLKNCDLRAKSLTRTRFQGVKNLDLARVGKNLLSQPHVRELLINPNMGYKKNYFKANLRGANLDNANLKGANFAQADLSEATFKNADLRDSNLTEVNAINTNLTHVYLTGACIEGWNIDQSTILDKIDCQYVYFLNNKQERRPSSGDFELGEFSKLFKQVLDSIVLIFQNGINWKAFASAFKEVQVKHQETPLEIETIENKGEGMVVIKVKVSPDANKAKIHQDFIQDYQFNLREIEASYQKKLAGKEKEIDISNQQINSLDNIVDILANLPDQSQPIKTIKLLPDGQGIETIEEEQNITQNQVSSQMIRELQKEYKKTRKLIEEKYEAILESKEEIIESKQMQIEQKQKQINNLNEQLEFFEDLTNKYNKERLNMNFGQNNDTVNE